MYELFGRERIKLVAQEKSIDKNFSVQLTFDFPEPPQLILLMESSFQQEGFFSTLIEKFRPCFIFDTRTAPRLDFIANNRGQAFKRLAEANLKYVDLHYAIEKSTLNENLIDYEWLNSALEVVDDSTCKSGPYLFIFDSDIILKGSKKIIPEKFMEAGVLKKTPSIAGNELFF